MLAWVCHQWMHMCKASKWRLRAKRTPKRSAPAGRDRFVPFFFSLERLVKSGSCFFMFLFVLLKIVLLLLLLWRCRNMSLANWPSWPLLKVLFLLCLQSISFDAETRTYALSSQRQNVIVLREIRKRICSLGTPNSNDHLRHM